jgi:hypothetical protein
LLPWFLVSLETTGHRTGQRHAIPVVLADYAGERYIVSMLGRAFSVGAQHPHGGRPRGQQQQHLGVQVAF